MKRFWYFAVILVFLLAVTACQSKAKQEPAVADTQVLVSAVTGEAQLQHGSDGEKQPLTVGQTLAESDIISSGADTLVVIALEEGKEIHIGENTVFALSAIRRDATGNVNILALKQGSIVNIVDTPLAEDDVYEVHTPRLVMSVRGTSNYMETNGDSDTVIGITGQTHVFSGGGAANVVPGMMAEIDQNATSPKLSPRDSKSLPSLASNYAKEQDISYDALKQDDITKSQQGANDHKPSTKYANDFIDRIFKDDSITVPDSKNSGNAPAPDTSSVSSSESASSAPEPVSESASSAASVSSATSVPPVAATQTPSPSTAAESSTASSSKAESSSSALSSSQAAELSSTDWSSSRSAGSNRNSSDRSSSSSKSPAPKPPVTSEPEPQTEIEVVFLDCFNAKQSYGSQTFAVTDGEAMELNSEDLELPTDCYLSTSVDGSSWLGDDGNEFPISADGSDTVEVYVFYAGNKAVDEPVDLKFYHETEGFMGENTLTILFEELLTDEGIDIDCVFAESASALETLFPNGAREIKDGKITLDMLFVKNGQTPCNFPTDKYDGSFCLWIPVTPNIIFS